MSVETEVGRLVVRLVGDASEYDEELHKAVQHQEAVNASIQHAAEILNFTGTAIEKYTQQVMWLDNALKLQMIDQDQYNEGLQSAVDQHDEATGVVKRLADIEREAAAEQERR